MLSRALALIPSSRTCAWMASDSSNIAATNASCSSRSAGMMRLQHAICLAGLGNEHVEIRNLRVPFDERRDGAESLQRRGIQTPHFAAHRSAVRVDANLAPADGVDAMPGEMNLLHVFTRDAVDEAKRI